MKICTELTDSEEFPYQVGVRDEIGEFVPLAGFNDHSAAMRHERMLREAYTAILDFIPPNNHWASLWAINGALLLPD